MSAPVVGIDLRQFFSHPYASGIQRVILGILENWPMTHSSGRVLCGQDERLFFISLEAAARCIRACFDFSEEYSGANDSLREVVADQLRRELRVETSWPEALLMVDRWLAPEPTTNPSILRHWRDIRDVMPTTFVFYDALPQINPEFYKPSDSVKWSEYFRLIASAHRVVSISDHVSGVLSGRLRNGRPCASKVAYPGADHVEVMSSTAPLKTSFLTVSSIEKRKRVGVLVEAFAQAATEIRNMELHIVGRRNSDSDLVQGAISRHHGSRILWSRDANDNALGTIASRSTALFSVGEEGYGMPVLEMLRRGCPVVFAGTQPAAELALDHGAIKLTDHSVGSIAAAMVRLADHGEASRLRQSIAPHRLPKWAGFANAVAEATLSRECGCSI